MTRREFLQFLLAIPVVGPTVIKAAGAPAAVALSPVPTNPLFSGELGIWHGVRWVVKDFSWGTKVGVALEIKNRETGERRRNGVLFSRMGLDAENAKTAYDLLGNWAEAIAGHPVALPHYGLLNPCGDCDGATCECGVEVVSVASPEA